MDSAIFALSLQIARKNNNNLYTVINTRPMKKILSFVSTLLVGSSWLAAQQAQKPNVIVVLADDLGFGDVSAYGSKTISTPNIDGLARGGACFTNAYATSATSTPSRYGMFTASIPGATPKPESSPATLLSSSVKMNSPCPR